MQGRLQIDVLSDKIQLSLRRRQGSYRWALFDAFRRDSVIVAVFFALGESSVACAAFLARFVIQYASDVYNGDTSAAWRGWIVVAAILVLNLAASFLNTNAEYLGTRTGALARAATVALIYQKAMTISPRAQVKNGYDDGAIVALVSRNADRLSSDSLRIPQMWGMLLSLVVVATFLTINLGASAWTGIALLVLVKPWQVTLVCRQIFKFRRNALDIGKQRSTLMLAILRGIRCIKYFAWEKSFAVIVGTLRWAETRAMRKIHYGNTGNHHFDQTLIGVVALLSKPFPCSHAFFLYHREENRLITAAVFVTYKLTGHAFTPGIILSSFALLACSSEAIVSTAMSKSFLESALLAIDDIGAFLRSEDRQETLGADKEEEKLATGLCGASFAWDVKDGETTFELQDIDVCFPLGLTAVVGSVASGKSSLLKAMVGEMRMTGGSMSTTGAKPTVPRSRGSRMARFETT